MIVSWVLNHIAIVKIFLVEPLTTEGSFFYYQNRRFVREIDIVDVVLRGC